MRTRELERAEAKKAKEEQQYRGLLWVIRRTMAQPDSLFATYTNAELAEHVGVSRRTFQRWLTRPAFVEGVKQAKVEREAERKRRKAKRYATMLAEIKAAENARKAHLSEVRRQAAYKRWRK